MRHNMHYVAFHHGLDPLARVGVASLVNATQLSQVPGGRVVSFVSTTASADKHCMQRWKHSSDKRRARDAGAAHTPLLLNASSIRTSAEWAKRKCSD